MDEAAGKWLLSAQERGNPAAEIPAWREGNHVKVLDHGRAYFARLAEEIGKLQKGDALYFTDWRGDPDEKLTDDGPSVAEALKAAAGRGATIKGLVWRSHWDKLQYSKQENQHLGEEVEEAGGEVLLDQRVRRGGSHHQKLVVIRHQRHPQQDVAFTGGIDLCHSRRDDREHRGDPQAVRMAKAYGKHPPWHDVQLEIHGPVVADLEQSFRERWEDHTPIDAHSPLAWLQDKLNHTDLDAGKLPPAGDVPQKAGSHIVQVLRSYPERMQNYDFAPDGERSIARAYTKAIKNARSIIFVSDQYLWGKQVAELFAEALEKNPQLHLVAIVPRHPDVDGGWSLPPNQIGRRQALKVCQAAGRERVHVYDLENAAGTPIYVHAKLCVIDDIWAAVGSANLNRRSWGHDTELTCAVLDQEHELREPTEMGSGKARKFARELRMQMWEEHLGGTCPSDPLEGIKALDAAAEKLEAWHENGRQGPRPPGQLRHHKAEQVGLITRMWATPIYQLLYDPDGRPWKLRRQNRW